MTDRLLAKVHAVGPAECWWWMGELDRHGYGRVRVSSPQRRSTGAHRAVYEELVGPVPEGLEIDHLCRNPRCVNPGHLEPVTHAENGRRGRAGEVNAARQRAKTHCPQGHPYDGDNLYVRPNGRGCKACRLAAKARYRERRRGMG